MELSHVIEALLFAAEKPLTLLQIKTVLKEAAVASPALETENFATTKEEEIIAAIEKLSENYRVNGSAFTIQEIANGFQLRTRPEAAPWLQQLLLDPKAGRLSQPALETLAIIAYRQPISRADIEVIRGVAVDGVLNTLLDRKLIRIAGRSELPGRPLIYETTPKFMENFCLKNLDELPNADELRKMELPKPPQLLSDSNDNQRASTTDRPAGSPVATTS